MSALTTRQRTELTAAMVGYLEGNGPAMATSAANFRREAGLPADGAPLSPAAKGGLEKKWSTIAALNKSIADLEEKVQMLEAIERRNEAAAAAGASTAEDA